MLLLLNISILLGVACIILAFLRVDEIVSYVLGCFLLSYGVLVVMVQMLSLVHGLGAANYFRISLFALALGLAGWLRFGRPPLLAPFRATGIGLGAAVDVIGRNFPLVVFGVMVVHSLAQVALDAALTRTMVEDARFYHLYRLPVWLQQGSVFFDRQLAALYPYRAVLKAPFNSEIGYLWVFLGTGSLKGTDLIEVVSGVLLGVAIYGCAFALSNSKQAAAWAALIFFTFCVVIWDMAQSISIASSSAFFVTAVYFMLRIESENRKADIFLFSLALALAVGTKATIYFMIPAGLVIFPLLMIRSVRKASDGKYGLLAYWAASVSISALLFCGGLLINTTIVYRSPIPQSRLESHRDNNSDSLADVWTCGTLNFPRYTYLQLSPITDALEERFGDSYLVRLRRAATFLNLPLEDNVCSTQGFSFGAAKRYAVYQFGWAYQILFVPAILAFARRLRRPFSYGRIAILCFWASFYVLLYVLRKWHLGNLRYFLLPGALLAVMLVDLLYTLRRNALGQVALLLLGLVALGHLQRQFPGVYTSYAPWRKSLGAEQIRSHVDSVFELLDSVLTGGTRVLYLDAYKVPVDIYGYRLQREVVRVEKSSLAAELGDPAYDFAVQSGLQSLGKDAASALRREYELVLDTRVLRARFRIYARRDPAVDTPDFYQGKFPPTAPFLIIDPSLRQWVRIGPAFSAEFRYGALADDDPILFSVTSLCPVLRVEVEIRTTGRQPIRIGFSHYSESSAGGRRRTAWSRVSLAEGTIDLDPGTAPMNRLALRLTEGYNYVQLDPAKGLLIESIAVRPSRATKSETACEK